MHEAGSVVVRRQLGRELRGWRERANRTLDDVAATQIASVSKVQRIEHGRTSVRPGDVRELCHLYGVSRETTEALAALARATTDPDWWERPHPTTPSWFALYLRLEALASELWSFHPALVHGLLQTAGYARAVERACHPQDAAFGAPGEPCPDVERFVLARLARQEQVFARRQPLHLRLVLGERALLLPDHLAADQYRSLHERCQRDEVEIRVLPLTAGLHPGMRGAFSVLRFDDPADPPVAYVETYEGARYPEHPDQVAAYRRRFEQIRSITIPFEEWLT